MSVPFLYVAIIPDVFVSFTLFIQKWPQFDKNCMRFHCEQTEDAVKIQISWFDQQEEKIKWKSFETAGMSNLKPSLYLI